MALTLLLKVSNTIREINNELEEACEHAAEISGSL